MSAPDARVNGERGSVLMLMPAAVLVLIVLAAIAADFAIVLLGERELADLAASAANDAAVAAIGPEALYECGNLVIDGGAAETAAARVAAGRGSDAVDGVAVSVDGIDYAEGVPRVTVTATGSVDLVFSPALPGAPARRQVQATSIAIAQVAGPDAGAVATGPC